MMFAAFLTAWFAAQLATLHVHGTGTMEYWFMSPVPSTYPPELAPGDLLFFLSHDPSRHLHFVGNVVGFVIFGRVFEPVIGWQRVAVLTLVFGAIGSVASNLVFAPIVEMWLMAGISGGVFALIIYIYLSRDLVKYGLQVITLNNMPESRFIDYIQYATLLMLVGNLVMTQNPGHIAGALLGAAFFAVESLTSNRSWEIPATPTSPN